MVSSVGYCHSPSAAHPEVVVVVMFVDCNMRILWAQIYWITRTQAWRAVRSYAIHFVARVSGVRCAQSYVSSVDRLAVVVARAVALLQVWPCAVGALVSVQTDV
jgi:hypothetical protein